MSVHDAPVTPTVSVVMPTYDQQQFLPRAVQSLRQQTVTDWELHVVDDGSPEEARHALAPFAGDRRISLHRLPSNHGLGAACNVALDDSAAPFVAYLPSDDVWYPRHLEHLLTTARRTGAALVWTGMRHAGRAMTHPSEEHGLQLVQVLHRRTRARWVERNRLESDDLGALFFDALRMQGPTASTGTVTCEWQDHPGQRHKAMRERYDGGLNTFRARYQIADPLRFSSRDSGYVDEFSLYEPFRRRPAAVREDSLKILLVGELAYHPERIVALEERGHELSGLWISDPLGPHAVGPLPFGRVRDLPRQGWQRALEREQPDVIYAQQNWRAVPLAHEVLTADTGIPFVWHFKEAPQRCLTRGTWPLLADLVAGADLCLYATEEEREWFAFSLPGHVAKGHVLDGDLPKAERFSGIHRRRLSETDGAVHVACVGRPVGIDAAFVATLAAADIHVHFHGLVSAPGPSGSWRGWIDEALAVAPAHVHVHPAVSPDRWLADLSVYDAGLLHRFSSENHGHIERATWDDLNAPARIGTYAAAHLPLLFPRQEGHVVAAQELIRSTGAGLLYADASDLCEQLRGGSPLEAARDALTRQRPRFTFDHHVPRLERLFRALVR